MKTKTWLLVLVGIILLGYGFNITSLTPRWFEEGRVYDTVFAEGIDGRAVLIARESNDPYPYYSDGKVFMVSRKGWPGYPPKKFRIRMGMVYPIEWSKTWGHQK
jgi:hypothetical protein